jgi:hypothetical protein
MRRKEKRRYHEKWKNINEGEWEMKDTSVSEG